MVELEIDGKKITAEDGATIIEAADRHGIYIPRFCYHKNLSIAANCRMCLVEVERMGKPQPACATPVTSDMKVFTKSKKALEAQRVVMEFLLINHPLDCPICDQGGECELQDLAMGYGSPYSYFDEGKRSVYSEDIGMLIETEMTRCIQCTRCVRFGEEVANLRELGVIGRGEKEEISTYIKHFLRSELSGNIIDLCPVGALTAKPSRYSVRGWELREHATIAPHDCIGSNIFVHSREQEYAPQRTVRRVVPRENAKINDTWISDRDRFSYLGLYHEDRVYEPRVKKNGQWQTTEWEPALLEIVDRLSAIIHEQGADQVAALTSANTTLEPLYLLQKLMRGLGSHNIDHRIHEHDFRDQELTPEFPNLGMLIADIETLDTILLVGSDLLSEAPMLWHRVNQARLNDAKVMALNLVDYDINFDLTENWVNRDIVTALAEVAKVLADDAGRNIAALQYIEPSEIAKRIAKQLQASKNSIVLVGAQVANHPQASQLRNLARLIATLTSVKIGAITEGANTAGAWLAGAVPHRGAAGASVESTGKDAKTLLTTDPVRAYLLLNMEPELDCAYPAEALSALQQAGLVVCLTPYATPAMEAYADFILPIAPFTETAGTLVNIEGQWQSFAAVTIPHGETKPAWKILRVLGNLFELSGFQHQTAHEVRDELQQQVANMPPYEPSEPKLQPIERMSDDLLRLAPWPIYRVDAIVRRAGALQEARQQIVNCVRVNQAVAEELHARTGDTIIVKQGDQEVNLPLQVDDRIADRVVLLPAGLTETAGFGTAMATCTLSKVGAIK